MSDGHPDALALNLDEVEGAAVFSAVDILLGEEGERKEALVAGLLFGQGDFQGVSCISSSQRQNEGLKLMVFLGTRLLDIVDSFLDPHPITPLPEQIEEEDGK